MQNRWSKLLIVATFQCSREKKVGKEFRLVRDLKPCLRDTGAAVYQLTLQANRKLVETLATAGTDSRSRGTRHDIRGVDCAGSRNKNSLYINSFTNKKMIVIR